MCALSPVNTETRLTTAKQGAAVPWLARAKIGAPDPARECPLQGAWECQGGLMLGPFQGSGGLHYRLIGSDQGYRQSIVRVAGSPARCWRRPLRRPRRIFLALRHVGIRGNSYEGPIGAHGVVPKLKSLRHLPY
jgi:hypothetical protein